MADFVQAQQLLARYCYAHDARDLTMLRTCFSRDARMQGATGPDAIVDAYAAMYTRLTARRRHVLTNFFFLEETETAGLLQAYETFYLIRDEKLELHLTGIYRARVVLEDGAWKIHTIEASFDVPFNPGDLPGAPASDFS
jgi:hypothetical protein